jgi:molecular chaperone GrpE
MSEEATEQVVQEEATEQVVQEEATEQVVQEVVEPGQEADPVATLTANLQRERAELIADLQRERADYANYRKRQESLRAEAHESAVGAVLKELVALLDDVDRAEQHGELCVGFKAVAGRLNSITSHIGLEKYGTEGEAFDPQIHEALTNEESSEVLVPTASKILRPGYKYKNRILRHAGVSVTGPVGA